MKSRAAVFFEVGRKLEVREVDVQGPGLREAPIDKLDALTQVVPLAEVVALGGEILKGRVRGRVVVDVNA